MWQILHRNPGAFWASLVLHLILALLALVGMDWLDTSQDVRTRPRAVQATVVGAKALEAEVARLRKREQDKLTERLRAEQELERLEARKRQEQEQKRLLQALAEERQHHEQEAQRQVQEEARQRTEAERQAQEAARRQAEAERQTAEQAQRQAQEEARRAREDDLLAALDAEQAASELDSYVTAIHERIGRVWVRQPGMGRNLSCLVEAGLLPGGEVAPGSVRVIRGSGNPAFDHSVVAAVYKASPLPVPDGRLFEQFRDLRFDFSP